MRPQIRRLLADLSHSGSRLEFQVAVSQTAWAQAWDDDAGKHVFKFAPSSFGPAGVTPFHVRLSP